MRAVLCVDVEPDRRESEYPGPAKWDGADRLLADHEWLRAAISRTAADPVINWFIRIDPQIEGSHGSATWAAEHYGEALTGFERFGDELGLHVHSWRWSDATDRWVSDGTDEWVEHVAKSALAEFRAVFGRACRSYRHGDRAISDALVRVLLDDPEVVVDLTLEPGLPAARRLVDSECAIGITRHVDLGLGGRYQPSPDHVDIESPPDGRLTMVPLTVGVVPGAPHPETMVLWRDPDQFRRMLRLRLLDPDLDHLAFAVRSDMALLPWARENVATNMRWIGEVLPAMPWVQASTMALEPAAVAERPLGIAGGMGRELDGVLDRLVAYGVHCGPTTVVDAVERVADRADRDAAATVELRAANEQMQSDLADCRAAVAENERQLEAALDRNRELAARCESLELELSTIQDTLTWRARNRLLPLLRPLARVRRRLADAGRND